MSDEPKQPTLRLKPRLKQEPAESAPAPLPPNTAEESPAPTVPAKADSPFKLRPAPPTADISSTQAPSTGPKPPPPAAPEAFIPAIVPEPAASPELPVPPTPPKTPQGFKLNPKTPPTAHPHPQGVPPAFIIDEAPSLEPPVAPVGEKSAIPPPPAPPPPVQAATPLALKPSPALPAASAASLPKPKVPHFKPSERLNLPEENKAAKKPVSESKGFKIGLLLIALLFLLVLAGTGYFAWAYFTAEPPAEPVVNKPVPAPTPPPSPAPAATSPAAPSSPLATETPQSTPGRLIQKAQEAVTARRDIEQGRVDNILDGKDIPDQRGFPLSPNQSEPANTSPPPTTYSEIAPGITATDTSITKATKSSATFRRTVSEFVIRGVFQGSPARAHINGRMVIQGNPVDRDLGIIFVSVNPKDKTLTFKDGTGATVTRRY